MAVKKNTNAPDSDVVISSRVRIARNLSDYPFPSSMTQEQSGEIVSKVREALSGAGTASESFVFIDLQKTGALEKQVLVEKHLVSPVMLEAGNTKGVIISRDETVSIMINEEDHLRIQCIYPGMRIEKAWELGGRVDSLLEKKLDFAFSKEFGYLTCCPTNVGTGIRASVMLHLPALIMTGYIGRVLEACGKLRIAVRGLYGENTEASGNIFQVSNQVALGLSEEEIISGISNVSAQIVEQERALRSELSRQNLLRLEDRVYRSYGLLANSRIISSEESMKLLSDVRLGVDMGIIENVAPTVIDEIMLLLQPASLQVAAGRSLEADERDMKRAEFIRNKLKGGKQSRA